MVQVKFSADGNFLYTGARKDPDILCWDVRYTSDVVYRMQRDTADTNQRIQFDIEPVGRHLATGACPFQQKPTCRALLCPIWLCPALKGFALLESLCKQAPNNMFRHEVCRSSLHTTVQFVRCLQASATSCNAAASLSCVLALCYVFPVCWPVFANARRWSSKPDVCLI